MNIGLYLSESSGKVSQAIDLARLTSEYSTLPVVRTFDSFFKPRVVNVITSDIKSEQLDAVVLAGESPFYYSANREADFIIGEIEKSGISLNRIGFANIREHAALPHRANPQGAFTKAKLLIDVAIEKVKHSEPLKTIEFPPKKRVAIIGSTTEGLSIAAKLLRHGYKVSIIEKGSKVRVPEDDIPRMRATVGFVLGHKNLSVFSETTVKEITGYYGDFTLYIDKKGQAEQLSVGAVVAATGDDAAYASELHSVLFIDIDTSGNFKPVNRDTMLTTTKRPGIFIVAKSDNMAMKAALADSVALNVMSLLDEPELLYEIPVSHVDEKLCGGCGTCIKTCMFKASHINDIKRLARVDTARCRGCGNCVTSCPTGARDLLTYPTKYLHSAIEILAQHPASGDPSVLYLLCEGCGYPSLDIAGLSNAEYSTNILPLGVKCGARVDTQLILEAFAKGFDGVIIGKCKEDKCENLVGSIDLDRRANLFREILRSRGVNSERLRIIGIDGCEDGKAADEAETFLKDLKKMEVSA